MIVLYNVCIVCIRISLAQKKPKELFLGAPLRSDNKSYNHDVANHYKKNSCNTNEHVIL